MLNWVIKQGVLLSVVIALPSKFWPLAIIYAFVWSIFFLIFGALITESWAQGFIILFAGLATLVFLQTVANVFIFFMMRRL